MKTMKATVFHGANDIRVEEVNRPHAGIGEAVIRVTLTTICGTDLHIVRGEFPVKPVLIIGHEPVGVVEALGPGVTGYETGDRVLVGAITPCGQCRARLSGHLSQCRHGDGYEALGGWRFGNTINRAQAEYLLVPSAQANLAKILDELTDEQVVLLSDIASTGFSGAEAAPARLDDHRIVITLCPGGKERMRRLLSLVQSGRFDPTPLITHRFSLEEIPQAYQLFGERSDGVLKVAIKP